MTINGKNFKTFIGEAELQQIVGRLAGELNRDYAGRNLVVCPILTGAFMFASDLVRKLTVPCEVSFVRYSSYCGMSSTGKVSCSLPFPASVEGRDVLIVEDVVDSGFSIQHIMGDLEKMHPASVRVCALFYKPDAFKGNYKVDYIGRNIGNEFIVGYGLDYDEQGRNLPEVMVVCS
jgi:hypoxanthine phosphoribosyltransferase